MRALTPSSFRLPHCDTYFGGGGGLRVGSVQQTSRKLGHSEINSVAEDLAGSGVPDLVADVLFPPSRGLILKMVQKSVRGTS